MSWLWLAAPASAAPCDLIKTPQQTALMNELLRTEHPYDCCDETIAECLAAPKVCKLARRLRDDICRRIAAGEPRDQIQRALARRAESMTPIGKPATIALAGAPCAGDPNAPVVATVYACARCPYCARVVPALYRAVTQGALRGKAKLCFRVFPIRGHKDGTVANLAFQAAHRLGAFWPFALHAFSHFSEFAPEKLADWARAAGLEPEALTRATEDAAVRAAVVDSKKEGIVNKVDGTPTFFINGRRVTTTPDAETTSELIDEEADRVTGASYCGAR